MQVARPLPTAHCPLPTTHSLTARPVQPAVDDAGSEREGSSPGRGGRALTRQGTPTLISTC